jgi:demethylmenaquinone methyltransferase/2-methoxy-6-polyprenyl-1,4-benzoquinol methylase
MNEKDKKNFGFEKVSSKEKRTLVDGVFSDVAGKYDLMNDLISFGAHRLWKDEFCNMIPNMDSKILDVAGGTGDISFKLKEKGKAQNKDTHIIASDINQEMLEICQSRAIDRNTLNNFDLVAADAEKLPFPDNSFDYYTIAFGIRNMVSIENALAEALRVLKPTGKFLCLEFSKVQNDIVKPLYDFYTFNVIPKIGNCVVGNQDAYRYLAESISLFPDQEDFKTMIQKTGFTNVAYRNLTFGTAAIHYGFKG